jgi:DNA-binding NtrC family response regulator
MPLDAIVSDFAMPGMSGAELMLQVAWIRPDLPGLIVTGYPGVERLGELPKRIRVLHKPVSRAELVEQVRILLNQNGGRQTATRHQHRRF